MINVVIYDDNKQRRESLQALIYLTENMNCSGSFPDCSNVLHDIENTKPDVVLMDIEMPNVGGITGVSIIKKNFPNTRIIMQTVFEDDDKIFASLCNGASGYILKNTAPEKVLQAIREVAEGGSFFTPSVAKKVLNNFQQQPQQGEFIQLTDKEKEVLNNLDRSILTRFF